MGKRRFRNLAGLRLQILFELTPDAPEQFALMILNYRGSDAARRFFSGAEPERRCCAKTGDSSKSSMCEKLFALCKSISQRRLEIASIQQKLQREWWPHNFPMASGAPICVRRSRRSARTRRGGGGSEEQAQQLRARLQEANPPEAVMKQAERELKRLDFFPRQPGIFSDRQLHRDHRRSAVEQN